MGVIPRDTAPYRPVACRHRDSPRGVGASARGDRVRGDGCRVAVGDSHVFDALHGRGVRCCQPG